MSIVLSGMTLGASVTAAATGAETGSLDLLTMGMQLLGGLAIFLIGMEGMSDGLKAAAGDNMRLFLERFTRTRVSAALSGAAVTAAVQSSSITTVLVVGFVSAGVMSLTQSIGVIMGANIGTTVTAQIVAFRIDEYALGMVATGFLMSAISKEDQPRNWGAVLLGLGLVFFGMGIMSSAMVPLRTYLPFIELMREVADTPLLGMIIAALFTALIQSSSATTGIVVVMAAEGLISLEAGIALALGANIGTCVTAALSAIGKPVEARRAAMVHILFNVAGALVWLPLIDLLAEMARYISPVSEGLDAAARLAADSPRQIANANTLFNIINTIFFLPLAGSIALVVTRLVPPREEDTVGVVEPAFIDRRLIDHPAFALNAARQETARLGDLICDMLNELRDAAAARDPGMMASIAQKGHDGDVLLPEISAYLAEIAKEELTAEDTADLQALLGAVAQFGAINDLMTNRLIPFVTGYLTAPETQAQPDTKRMREAYALILEALREATEAIRSDDASAAQRTLDIKEPLISVLEEITEGKGLDYTAPDVVSVYRRELEISTIFRLFSSLTRRIAEAALHGTQRARTDA